MRVLHVNKRYPPHIGGIERHLQELARAEARLLSEFTLGGMVDRVLGVYEEVAGAR
jgi:hypothetical protein